MHTMDTQEDWDKFIAAVHRGDLCEIEYNIFEYFLEVLPPRWMAHTVKVQGVERYCEFGQGEGWDTTTAFWIENDRWFCQKMREPHKYDEELS